MTQLHEALDDQVRAWRAAGYPSADPAIAEIPDLLGEDIFVTREL